MAREIVLDTETTGLDPRGHRIIEIACIEIEDFLPTGNHFHRFIDPERDIDPDAERVHGISRASLYGKPKFAEGELVWLTGSMLVSNGDIIPAGTMALITGGPEALLGDVGYPVLVGEKAVVINGKILSRRGPKGLQ